MDIFGYNLNLYSKIFCFVLVASLFFSSSSFAQNEEDSVRSITEDTNQSNVIDLPVSYEESEKLLGAGKMASALESYYAIDNSIFSVADFLSMVAEKFPNYDPWINIRELEFRLHEYNMYVSLKGQLYLKSEFFYTNEKKIERISINTP